MWLRWHGRCCNPCMMQRSRRISGIAVAILAHLGTPAGCTTKQVPTGEQTEATEGSECEDLLILAVDSVRLEWAGGPRLHPRRPRRTARDKSRTQLHRRRHHLRLPTSVRRRCTCRLQRSAHPRTRLERIDRIHCGRRVAQGQTGRRAQRVQRSHC